MKRHHHRGGKRRKFDDYPVTFTGTLTPTGTTDVHDVMSQFKTDFGSVPHQATLSIPRFDLSTVGTGTGTGVNSITLGFCVGPNTLDALDLDPSASSRIFWWTRKYYLQNNSNPVGVLWAIQGMDANNWKVNTRRTIKELDATLFTAVRADFTGFTQIDYVLNMHVGILYP